MGKVEAAKVRAGVSRYLQEEFIDKLTGAKQFVMGTATGAVTQLIQSDVDIDWIYKSAKQQFQTKPSVTITKEDLQDMHPMAGVVGSLLGPVTINAADLDKLYRYIMEG